MQRVYRNGKTPNERKVSRPNLVSLFSSFVYLLSKSEDRRVLSTSNRNRVLFKYL